MLTLPKEYHTKDKDGDGQLGLYEWERSKYAEFAKLDKNGDGFLTPLELNPKKPGSSKRSRIGGKAEEALPNPGNVHNDNLRIGESFTFSVTGRASGPIWGTDVYTTDSDLASAAVHAGILKNGETGSIKVTITESPEQFVGSAANGVTSGAWQKFPAAFVIE